MDKEVVLKYGALEMSGEGFYAPFSTFILTGLMGKLIPKLNYIFFTFYFPKKKMMA